MASTEAMGHHPGVTDDRHRQHPEGLGESAADFQDPRDLHAPVGAVVLAASEVERALLLLTIELLGGFGAVVAKGQPPRTLADWCRRLTDEVVQHEQLATDIVGDLNRCEHLLDQRHDVAHGAWFRSEEGTQTVRLRRRAPSVKDWSLSSLERLRQDLLNVAGDLTLDRMNVECWRNGEALLPHRAGDVEQLNHPG
jgi:hypothetical protein